MMILLDMKMPESCSDCELRFCGICEQGYDKVPCPIKAEIPNGATNSDVIKTVFPSIEICDNPVNEKVYTGIPHNEIIGANIDATHDWWDAPYKGMKNE